MNKIRQIVNFSSLFVIIAFMFLMPWLFYQKTQEQMQEFKTFIEEETTIEDSAFNIYYTEENIYENVNIAISLCIIYILLTLIIYIIITFCFITLSQNIKKKKRMLSRIKLLIGTEFFALCVFILGSVALFNIYPVHYYLRIEVAYGFFSFAEQTFTFFVFILQPILIIFTLLMTTWLMVELLMQNRKLKEETKLTI